MCLLTCSELKIVKSQAKTVALASSVRIPNTHVKPRSGKRITVARRIVLQWFGENHMAVTIYFQNSSHTILHTILCTHTQMTNLTVSFISVTVFKGQRRGVGSLYKICHIFFAFIFSLLLSLLVLPQNSQS